MNATQIIGMTVAELQGAANDISATMIALGPERSAHYIADLSLVQEELTLRSRLAAIEPTVDVGRVCVSHETAYGVTMRFSREMTVY